MTRRKYGFFKGWYASIALLLLLAAQVGCAALNSILDSVTHVAEPVTTDTAETLSYQLPAISPDSAVQTDQTKSGLEIRVENTSVVDPSTSYTIKLSSITAPIAGAPAVPGHSADIVWNAFDHMVNGDSGHLSNVNPDAYGRISQPLPYVITLVPSVDPSSSPVFRVTVTNHTIKTISTVIHPQLYIDGVQYIDLVPEPEELDVARHGDATAAHLVHALNLAPGATDTWTYSGPPHLYEYNTTGTVLLKIPNVLVDPVRLKRESYQFVFDYRSIQRTRTVPKKSSTMAISKLEADSLDGKPVEYGP